MEKLATKVLDACKAKGWTLATAESCTGGMVATSLTQVSGSSDVVDRGYVTYSNMAKMQMIDVKSKTLEQYGAVSEQVALEMANGALIKSGTDIAISITGIAGPGPSEFKPEGRVCFGLAIKGGEKTAQTVEFGALGRESVRLESAQFALNLILKAAK